MAADLLVLIPPTDNLISLVFLVLCIIRWVRLWKEHGEVSGIMYIFFRTPVTVLAVFGLYAFYYFRYGVEVPPVCSRPDRHKLYYHVHFPGICGNLSRYEVMLYFILPIKMKWMALVYVVLAGYDFINGGIGIRVAIGASLLNFVIFFLSTRNYKRFGPREQRGRQKFKKQSSPHMTYTNARASSMCGVRPDGTG